MPETIPAAMRDAALRFGEKTALLPPDAPPMSFAALDALADVVVKALIAEDMAQGERIAVWAPNSCEWIAAAIGIQRGGGVLIPLYERLRGAEVAEILERAGASMAITTAALAEQLRAHDLPQVRRVICLHSGDAALAGREIGWDDFIARGKEVPDDTLAAREAAVTGDSISDIMFTSGTTGRPKGAVFRQSSGVAAGRIMQQYNGASESDVFCPMGTFAHVGGYKQGWLTGIVSGCAICWGDALDPQSVLRLIAKQGVTIIPAAPITWAGILDHPDRAGFDLSRLRFAATGATTIPPDLVRRMVADLQLEQVGTGYGMTETCGMTAFTRPDDAPEKVVSTVGQPTPDTEIRVVDADGGDLAMGETGEILVRNPRTLIEYLDDAEATAAALTPDGWFHTGDLGCFDAGGYLAITDRLKDMYIINGLNVYPAEIERALGTLEGVTQCAVIGVAEPIKGEVGAAFIVRAPGASLGEDDIRDWCRANLASYKLPKTITFVDDLPRTAMGKVIKPQLSQMLERQS
ncbi:MAG: AMP-binding protein [Novosphingobium sp.]|nr:AMP-binding protein [Novosphingobium sp.]